MPDVELDIALAERPRAAVHLREPGMIDSFADAKAIKEYARKNPRNANLATDLTALYGDRYIGLEHRRSVAQLDPELDYLLGTTGYGPTTGSRVDAERNAVDTMEKLYFAMNQGVDMRFMLDHMDDIHVFNGDPEAMTRVQNVAAWTRTFEEGDALKNDAFEAKVDFMLEVEGGTRKDAENNYARLEAAHKTVLAEVESLTDEEIVAQYSGALAGTDYGDIALESATPESLQAMRDKAYEERMRVWTEDLFGETDAGTNFWDAWNGNAQGIYQRTMAAFEYVTPIMQGAMQAGAWLIEQGVGPVTIAANVWGFAYENSPFGENLKLDAVEERQLLEMEAGKPDEEMIRKFAAEGLIEGWNNMKNSAPEQYAGYMAMAGGDEKLARAMWSEDAQYYNVDIDGEMRQQLGFGIGEEVSVRDLAEAAVEAYHSDINNRLMELEDSNFTLSDAVMDWVVIMGEMTNDIATAVTAAGKELFEGTAGLALTGEWDPIEFAEEFAKGSPSAVLGIDGTMVGLGFDLAMMAAADPMTWIFGPSLSGAGRTGAVSPTIARTMVESQAAAIPRQQFVSMLRSNARGALGMSAVLGSMGNTSTAARYMAAARGFIKPLLGNWKGLERWGALVDDVHVPNLKSLLPEGQIDDIARQSAVELLESGSYEPVVISINPETGAHGITSGADLVRAADGVYDNIKTTFKIDTKFGQAFDLPGVSPENVSRLQEVAGSTVDDLATTGIDETTRNQVLSQAELVAPSARPRGTVTLDNGAQFDVVANKKFYIAKDADGNVVAAIHATDGGGGVAVLDSPEYRGVTGRMLEVAMENGDDLLLDIIHDASISFDGAEWLIAQAQRRLGAGTLDAPTADWITLKGTDRAQDLDGTSYLAPRHMMPEEMRFGVDIDHDLLKQLEYEHIMSGGQPMSAQRLAMSVSVGQSVGEALGRWGVTDRIKQWMTPMNNSNVLRHTGPGSFGRTNDLLARLFGGVDDLDTLELTLQKVLAEQSRRGALEVRSTQLTIERQALREALDGLHPQQRLFTPEGDVQRFGIVDDTPIPVDDAAAVAAGFDDLEDFFRQEFAKNGMEFELEYNLPPKGQEKVPVVQEGMFPEFDTKRTEFGTATAAPETNPLGFGRSTQLEAAAETLRRVRSQVQRPGAARYEFDVTNEMAQRTRRQAREMEERAIELQKEADEIHKQLNDYSGLNDILQEAMDEFNRRHLATNKAWKHLVDPETGLVPWEEITLRSSKSNDFLEKILREASEKNMSPLEAADELGAALPEGVRQQLSLFNEVTQDQLADFIMRLVGSKRALTSFQMPASPLELLAAARSTPEALRKLGKMQWLQSVRDGAHAAHTAWMIDKVLTPRTGIVVSLDELMRIWQKGGVQSMGLWLEDRVITMAKGVTKITGDPTFSRLPQRWQQRIRQLQEIPDYYRDIQRSILETHGYGQDTIAFKKGAISDNVDYYAAAQQQAMSLTRDAGFAAYLDGEDAFRQWFLTSTDAAPLRGTDYYNAPDFSRAGLPHWRDAYNGYESVMEYALKNIKESKRGRARIEYKNAATRAASEKAAGPVPLWVLEGFGEVTGAMRVPANPMMRGVDWLSERIFQGPMNYRQGFLAELVRKSERARIEKLYKSQGINIVTDEELLRQLTSKYPSLDRAFLRDGLDFVADDLASRYRMVSNRQVNDMIERVVEQELEQTLYAFHRQSELGRHTRGLFPFGRPWADMWGHWGREMLQRPQLRGWINNTNYMNISQIANGLTDALPINPRTAGFVSRMAATDFDLENIEDDPLFGFAADKLGIDSLDASGAMFLPSQGRSPFLTMLPGLGLVPTVLAERLIEMRAPDPVENPQEFQQYMDEWSQFVPGVGYNEATTIPSAVYDTLIGGGVAGRFLTGVDALAMATGLTTSAVQDTITSDWKAATAHARATKVQFAQPELWAELAELDYQTIGVGLQALLNETLSNKQAESAQEVGIDRLIEAGVELLVPSSADTLTQDDDLQDVWFDALEFLPVSEVFRDRLNMTTEAGRAQAVEAISGFFYDMAPEARDNIIAAHPEMAVNMVSSWTWTDRAEQAGVEGSDLPYRSGGSTEARSRHETFVQKGWIRPLTPREMAINIIGTVHTVRARVAARVYTEAAEMVNEQRWQYLVPQEWKDWAQTVADEMSGSGNAPWTTGREVWENFTKVSDFIWELQGRPMREDGSPNMYRIPSGAEGFQPWGTSLPSDRDGLRDEFEEGYKLPAISDEMAEAARAIGIELTEGMGMDEVYQQVANYRADQLVENPAMVQFSGAFNAWLAPRGSEQEAAYITLTRAIDHEDVDPEYRLRLGQTMVYVEDAMERRRQGDDSWIETRNHAASLFESLKYDDYMRQLDLNTIWNDAYGGSLGALDWEPDEPPALYDEEGNVSDMAVQVLPNSIYDGDTIKFSTAPGRTLFGPLGGPTLPTEEYSVRLLGVNAREMGAEGGDEDRKLLVDAIEEALDNGTPIYLVRDPERYGNTDFYGRMFAWVYIGDEPFHRPETQMPRR